MTPVVRRHPAVQELVELTGQARLFLVGLALGEGVEPLARVLGVGRRVRLFGGVLVQGDDLLVLRLLARRGRLIRIRLLLRLDEQVLGHVLAALWHRVCISDLAELRIGEAVAVRVLEDDVLTELLRVANALDDAVVHGHGGRAFTAVDVDPALRGRAREDVRGIARAALGGSRALERLALGDVVGVAGLRRDGEVGSFGQAGERADEIVGDLAVLAGIKEDLVDVPVGVVVGEDRAGEILCTARGLEVVGGGADGVDRVVGILAAVVVRVDAVCLPGGGDELHPAERAGRRDVEVGAERGLDAVDRGQHLPGDPVLRSAGLVDREEEGRDRERVDDEVRYADRSGPEVGDRHRRVGVGRSSVRVASLRWTLRLVGIRRLILTFRVTLAAALAAAAISLAGVTRVLVELVAVVVAAFAVVAVVTVVGQVGVDRRDVGVLAGATVVGRSRWIRLVAVRGA